RPSSQFSPTLAVVRGRPGRNIAPALDQAQTGCLRSPAAECNVKSDALALGQAGDPGSLYGAKFPDHGSIDKGPPEPAPAHPASKPPGAGSDRSSSKPPRAGCGSISRTPLSQS